MRDSGRLVAAQPDPGDEIDDKQDGDDQEKCIMDLRSTETFLKFYDRRLYQADGGADKKAEHKGRFQCDPSVKVHEVAMIVPER